jgi:hypothetical protein
VAAIAIAGACLLPASDARAAAPYVDRPLTRPAGDWAFDFGLGVLRAYAPPVNPSGAGINVEGAVGLTRDIELGVRTGLRLGDDARAIHSDDYGRLWDRQTYDTGAAVLANPEVRITGTIARGPAAEVGLEGRVVLPFDAGTDAAVVAGLPLLFRAGNIVRIDTGVYFPAIFTQPVDTYVSVPFDLWFQTSGRLWLGPMTGFTFHNLNNRTTVPLGFGLGYQITRAVDFKTQILFPAINGAHGGETFGLGAGVQVRIE